VQSRRKPSCVAGLRDKPPSHLSARASPLACAPISFRNRHARLTLKTFLKKHENPKATPAILGIDRRGDGRVLGLSFPCARSAVLISPHGVPASGRGGGISSHGASIVRIKKNLLKKLLLSRVNTMRNACLAGVKTRIAGSQNPNCWESKPEGWE
jgi:hypothetical protein